MTPFLSSSSYSIRAVEAADTPFLREMLREAEAVLTKRPWLAARDARRADRLHRRVGADSVGEAAQRGEVLSHRSRRPPGLFECVAVAAHRRRRQVLGRCLGAKERGESTVDGGVGAPRLRRALLRGDLGCTCAQAGRVDELAGDRGGERAGGGLRLVSHQWSLA